MDFDGWLLGRLDAVKTDGLYRTLRTQETALKTKGQKRQIWASNDYLGLSKDERLITAAQTALSRFGAGSSGSRLTTGNTLWHEKLEKTIADFKQTEAALLFSSGYLANIGVLASLPQKGDVILSDQLNHASIVDGCRLSKTRKPLCTDILIWQISRTNLPPSSLGTAALSSRTAYSVWTAPLPRLTA